MFFFHLGLELEQSILSELDEAGADRSCFEDLVGHMANYLVRSRSDNTASKYFHYFVKWEQFIRDKGVISGQVSPIYVALYITDLMTRKCSYDVIASSVYIMKWVYSLKCLPDPIENLYVKNLLDSAKHILLKQVTKKEPVTKDMLTEICEKYKDSSDVLVVRDLCLIVLGFSAFLRYDELRNLRCNDLDFHDSYFSVKIRKSKTDNSRHGNDLVIAKGQSVACPYAMLKRYLEVTAHNTTMNMHLFRPCFRSRNVCRLIYKDKPLSYTRAREAILSRLKEVRNGMNLGLHSLRSDGATLAANSGVNDRCWKRHGRWRSENSKDGYIYMWQIL